MIKKIKNWFNNLNKHKCPNCKSTRIEKIEEKFIESKMITKYFQKIDKVSIMYGRSSITNIRGGYNTIEFYDAKINIYNIEYRCINCKNTWSETISRDM
jgi:hypothetical protein